MQVPNLEAPQVQEEPLPGRAYPRFSEDVPAAAYGESLAAGVENATQAATEIQARQKTQNDQLRVIDANTQLEAGRDALLYGNDGKGGAFALHGADAINLPPKLLPAYDQMAAKIAGTLTPDQQAIFQRHIATGRNELDLQLNRHESQEADRLAEETYANGQEQAVNSAALNWRDPEVIGKARADLKALNQIQAQHEGWTPEMLEQNTVNSLARMHGAVIDAMLTDGNASGANQYFEAHKSEIEAHDPKVAMEMQKTIEAGQVQQYSNQVLAGYQTSQQAGAAAMQAIPSDLEPAKRMQVIREVESGRRDIAAAKQQDPRVQAQMNAVDDAISGRQVTPQTLGAIESLWRQGALTDEQHMVKRDEYVRAAREGSQNEDALQYVHDALNDGRALDRKTDGKAINLGFSVDTIGMKAGTPGYNQAAATYTARLGVVPEAVEHYGRASLIGGSPQDAAQAAQLFATLQRVNSRAYEDSIDKKTQALAASINDAVSAGADPEGVVEMVRKNAEMGDTQRDMMNELWKSQRQHGQAWEGYDSDLIRYGLANDERYTTPGLLWGRNKSSVPDVPLPMAADFQRLSKDYFYYNGGNLQAAQAQALESLKGKWGVTEVNGQRELMPYAPEHMTGLTTAQIRDEMAKDGYGAAHLAPSPNTESSGGRKWFLQEPDKFGAWSTVHGDDNKPVEFTVPTASRASFDDEISRNLRADEDRAALMRDKAARDRAAQAQVSFPAVVPGGYPIAAPKL